MSNWIRVIATSIAFAVASASAFAQDTAPAARIITFDDALKIALEQNSSLRQAQNAKALGALGIEDAKSDFKPDLRASASGGQSWTSADIDSGAFGAGGGTQSSQSASLGLSSGVTVFNGFANTASLAAARFSDAASGSDLARTRETVVFTVATNFLSLVNQREQLRVQRENLAAQSALEQQIQTYVNAGARTIADLYQQQANAASARLAVVQAERAAEVANIDLIRTLLLDPAGVYEFVPPVIAGPENATRAPTLATLVNQAYETRPDIEASEARVSAAEESIRVARATRWPSVALSAGYNSSYNSQRDGAFIDQIDDRRGGSIGLNLSIPIYDRNATSIATRRAQIAADNARLNLETLNQEVGSQVRTALLDLQSAGEALLAAEAQRRAAERALEASRQRYAVGASTLVELTQVQATQVQAASAYISARYSVEFQRRLLDYYVGGLSEEKVKFP